MFSDILTKYINFYYEYILFLRLIFILQFLVDKTLINTSSLLKFYNLRLLNNKIYLKYKRYFIKRKNIKMYFCCKRILSF